MKKIKVLSWNVNGIRAVEKKAALQWFFDQEPEILCLQETKAQPDTFPQKLRSIDGYHTYFSSAERKGYSGVAMFSKSRPAQVAYGLGIARFDGEGRILVAEFSGFTLFNIYFPNGKQSAARLQYKLEFYEAFLKYINKLKKAGTNIVICGDINTAHKEIDLAHPRENEKISGFLPQERAWMDKLFEHGYYDTFRLFNQEPGNYTWWDLKSRARERNIGWRIDYFIISASLRKNIKSAFILPEITGSDHCPVGIEMVI